MPKGKCFCFASRRVGVFGDLLSKMQSFEMDNAQRQDNKENLNRHTPQNPQTEPNLEQRKRKGPRRIVYRFFHYTTINGLQRLASAKTIIGRLFWIAVLLAAFGLFSRDIYELVNQYYERPVTVVSKINYFRVRYQLATHL